MGSPSRKWNCLIRVMIKAWQTQFDIKSVT
jgi:hypothetical protein